MIGTSSLDARPTRGDELPVMNEILNHPVTENCAWTAAELAADSRWQHHLTADEIGELERLAEDLLRRGNPAPDFGRDDVPAPKLADLANWALAELDTGRGCVLIRGLDVSKYDRREIECLYWALGVHLGTPRHQNPDGHVIGEIADLGLNHDDPLVRGYKTSDGLGFHCDGLDIVSLLCLQTAKQGGESHIASSMAIFNEILATHPEYLAPLFNGFYFNLRGEGEPDETYPVTRNRVPVYSYFNGRLSCRLLSKAIREGQEFAGEPLTGLASDALAYMQALAPSDEFRYDMVFEPGDIQILNNFVTLHARAPFVDWPDAARKRRLLRLWINLREGRQLAPEFADRYNMGPREPMRLRVAQTVAESTF